MVMNQIVQKHWEWRPATSHPAPPAPFSSLDITCLSFLVWLAFIIFDNMLLTLLLDLSDLCNIDTLMQEVSIKLAFILMGDIETLWQLVPPALASWRVLVKVLG